jgi:hypothetical protein
MPGDDLTVVGNQHWIVEAEAFDRHCDLLDLRASAVQTWRESSLRREPEVQEGCYVLYLAT